MLLNKIPVLDKGWVALVDSCNSKKILMSLDEEFFNSQFPPVLLDLGELTVAMKCPLFVQINLSKFNLKVVNTYASTPLDAYNPNAAEIGARERSICEDIADDIARTTAALLINPSAYRADGADRFVSQLITPISTYTTIIVKGNYDEWSKFVGQSTNTPVAIKAYTNAIKDILTAEWP